MNCIVGCYGILLYFSIKYRVHVKLRSVVVFFHDQLPKDVVLCLQFSFFSKDPGLINAKGYHEILKQQQYLNNMCNKKSDV